MCYLVWENDVLEHVRRGSGLKSNRDLGRSEVWRRQSRRWWPKTPSHNEKGEGSEECWGSDWVLTEDYMLPKPTHAFWKMAKGIILYVRGKKTRALSKGMERVSSVSSTSQGRGGNR